MVSYGYLCGGLSPLLYYNTSNNASRLPELDLVLPCGGETSGDMRYEGYIVIQLELQCSTESQQQMRCMNKISMIMIN